MNTPPPPVNISTIEAEHRAHQHARAFDLFAYTQATPREMLSMNSAWSTLLFSQCADLASAWLDIPLPWSMPQQSVKVYKIKNGHRMKDDDYVYDIVANSEPTPTPLPSTLTLVEILTILGRKLGEIRNLSADMEHDLAPFKAERPAISCESVWDILFTGIPTKSITDDQLETLKLASIGHGCDSTGTHIFYFSLMKIAHTWYHQRQRLESRTVIISSKSLGTRTAPKMSTRKTDEINLPVGELKIVDDADTSTASTAPGTTDATSST